MSNFDQKNQNVDNQYNSGRDTHIHNQTSSGNNKLFGMSIGANIASLLNAIFGKRPSEDDYHNHSNHQSGDHHGTSDHLDGHQDITDHHH